MPMRAETVYLGTDNKIGLTLSVDGVAISDHTAITRAVLTFGAPGNFLAADAYLTIDSATTPAAFDFTDSARLLLILGGQTIPRGKHNVTVTIYMPGYARGLAFDTALDLRVQ